MMGLRHHLHIPVRVWHGMTSPKRSCTRHRPGCWVQMAINFRRSEQPSLNPSRPPNFQEFELFRNRLGRSSAQLLHSASSKNSSPLCTHAFENSGQRDPSLAGIEPDKEKPGKKANIVTKLLKNLAKALGGLLLGAILVAAALPSFLSSSRGRKTAISMTNRLIPGTFDVSVVKLGWSRPIYIAGVSLQGIDGETVLSIPKVETKAPLWSLVLRKSGLGDCTVTSPTFDLQQHPTFDLPRIALAVAPAEKLLEPTSRRKLANRKARQQVSVPPAEASLLVTVKGPKGGFQITDGKIIFASDVASVLGDRLVVDVGLGHFATKESDELKDAEGQIEGKPLLASFWSETVQAEASGFIQNNNKVKLIKPLKAEMDLTPAVAKFYLARVNPILGEVVGPAIRDEDMPDVIVQIAPADLELPSDHYKVHIAPMKVTLARGQVVDGILSLLSKQNLAKGRQDLTMQTSAIEANVDMPSSVESLRLDILIADNVHVATWGSMDWIEETVRMTLAIPGTTLKNVIGLTKIPPDYYLQVPVGGTLEKPVVDWRKAGLGIAELTARQRGGQFVQNVFDFFGKSSNEKSSESSIPEPVETLPWEEKAAK